MTYLGHRSDDDREQLLHCHLTGTAERAEKFAAAFGAGEIGYQLGLCHDIGKYTREFQDRLLRGGPKVDHATAGGQVIRNLAGPLFAYPIIGHHSGLPDGGSPRDAAGTPTLFGRLAKQPPDIPDYSAYSEEIALSLPAEPPLRPLYDAGFSVSMLIRMLFSCLVDADYLDTEHFMRDAQVSRGGYDDIPTLHARLTAYIDRFGKPIDAINIKRNQILSDCLQAAELPPGLYTLTVPTGGGKTIASLAFALSHAKEHGLNRVIYAIPYTSIIEQNAAVFAEIAGSENVLEHHANIDYDQAEDDTAERKHLSTENWDAPIVVTTNVQFFESFFASRTSRCRKLHNVAGSIIILDEAQMIPLPYLLPCVRVISELVHNYGCTVVLCTATQPALEGFFPPELPCREISTDPAGLYDFFRRTTFVPLGTLDDETLSGRLADTPQVLCIVNTRKQAQALFHLLPEEGRYHLSTTLYPEHRKRILNEIRARLAEGLPCRVVSTSLIEAGVDLDFPIVYRAEAGLDSIIQAAGRCNREGKRPADESPVYVFRSDEQYQTPLPQHALVEAYIYVAKRYDDLSSPEAIAAYFTFLYKIRGDTLDEQDIIKQLEDGMSKGGSFPFRSIDDAFKLIDSHTRTVLIPDTTEAAELAERLRRGERTRSLLRRVGRHSVSVYDNHYRDLRSLGIITPIDDEIAILAMLEAYNSHTGLTLTPSGGKALIV